MATNRRPKLPKYVQFSHGKHYYVRWNPSTKKVVWTPLGETYGQMLAALAEKHQDCGFTMEALLDRYETEVSNLQSPNTRRQREWQIRALKKSFGAMMPEDVTTKTVYRFLDDYTRRGTPVAANRIVSLLRRVFTKAIRWGYIDSNPANGIEKNKEKPRDRYITDAEYQLLLERVKPSVQRAVRLLYIGGQRVTNTLQIIWPQVQADGVHVHQAKTGKDLILEHSADLDAVLDECRAQPVLGRTVIADEAGQPLNYWQVANHIRREVRKLVAEGKIETPFTVHDLRRKAGSDGAGENLGHVDQRTLKRVYQVKPRIVKPTR